MSDKQYKHKLYDITTSWNEIFNDYPILLKYFDKKQKGLDDLDNLIGTKYMSTMIPTPAIMHDILDKLEEKGLIENER
jgi:hypothetical protein